MFNSVSKEILTSVGKILAFSVLAMLLHCDFGLAEENTPLLEPIQHYQDTEEQSQRRIDYPNNMAFNDFRNSLNIHAISVSRNGRTIAVGRGRYMELYHAGSDKPFARSAQSLREDYEHYILHGMEEWVVGLAFSADGRSVFGIRRDGAVLQWDAKTGRLIRKLGTHRRGASTIQLSQSGSLLATGGKDPGVMLWNLRESPEPIVLEKKSVLSILSFSSDESKLAIAANHPTPQIAVFDLRSKSKEFEISINPRDSIEYLEMQLENNHLLYATYSVRKPSTIHVVDTESKAEVKQIDTTYERCISSDYVSIGSNKLAAISGYGKLWIWDMQAIKCDHVFETGVDTPFALSWDPSQRSFLVADGSNIREFNLDRLERNSQSKRSTARESSQGE